MCCFEPKFKHFGEPGIVARARLMSLLSQVATTLQPRVALSLSALAYNYNVLFCVLPHTARAHKQPYTNLQDEIVSMAHEYSSVKILNDGNRIPVLGLGTWLTVGAEGAVSWALKQGYRMIDTASSYE